MTLPTALHRYWFEFGFSVANPHPSAIYWGCGVTGYSLEDAFQLLREYPFRNMELPAPTRIVEDVDVSALDPTHVIPFINPPNWRGVWYPRDYCNWDT
jgi:hypothetical protein